MKKPTFKLIPVLTAALVFLAAVCDASAALKIYKVKGDVTIKNKAKKTVKAQRRADVQPSDILTVPAGGGVDILDSSTHRIYSSVTTGSMSVKTLIDKAEAHAADITRNINRKVVAAVAENGGQKHTGYDVIGMAIHETDAIAYPHVSLPEGTSYLSYLLANATDPDSDHQSYIALSMQPVADGENNEDGAFNFAVRNSMRQPLYFNIMEKREGDEITLYFPQNPIAAPKSETVATEYTYLPDNNERGYIVIASDVDFTADDVKRLLEAGYEPDDDYYLSVLTINQ
ncbi:MAG: hypothetical protein K2H49_05180 [Muribaculaceae bacterium]|nr:hypothetical protein [Muribaculaceae bacterium]